jgi:hypothetical protein
MIKEFTPLLGYISWSSFQWIFCIIFSKCSNMCFTMLKMPSRWLQWLQNVQKSLAGLFRHLVWPKIEEDRLPGSSPSNLLSPPIYTSLNIHDKVLHNFLMDSRVSHNLMPKTVMEELGLEVTRAYHDLYSFDSRRVQCLGVIKDLVVTLFQLPMKSVVMDIVVVDVPPSSICYCQDLG